MDLATVKLFLRIDCDDDDEILELIMCAAQDYIIGAVGKCDFTKSKVKLLFLTIMQDMYDNRSMLGTDKIQQLSYTVNSIMQQLSLELLLEAGEDSAH